jgi:peroxiredoxin
MEEIENTDYTLQRKQRTKPDQIEELEWQGNATLPSTTQSNQENVQPDLVDIMRTWGILLVGGIAGIMIVLVLFFLFSQRGTQQPGVQLGVKPGGEGTATVGTTLEQGSLPPAPRVGRVAPDFMLSRFDGTQVRLSDYKGQPIWINFWASWCPPCRAEMPEMQQKYSSLKERGLVVLGVDVGEDENMVEEFVAERRFDWTFVLDKEGSVADQYATRGLPYHVFVGRDGTIKAIHVGGMPGNVMDRYLSMIIDR